MTRVIWKMIKDKVCAEICAFILCCSLAVITFDGLMMRIGWVEWCAAHLSVPGCGLEVLRSRHPQPGRDR